MSLIKARVEAAFKRLEGKLKRTGEPTDGI